MENNLIAVSPTGYAKMIKKSRQMVHQYIDNYESGKSGLPENVAKIDKMGTRYIIWVKPENVTIVTK